MPVAVSVVDWSICPGLARDERGSKGLVNTTVVLGGKSRVGLREPNQVCQSGALHSVRGVTVVTQKPPVVTVGRGETATMDCNLGTVTNYAGWYKQVPGGVPQYVLRWYHGWSSVEYGSGFSSPKFTSNHQSQSDYRLIINNVEEGDSAVYYCQTWDGSEIISQCPCGDISVPVVTLSPPSSDELKSNSASLVCLGDKLSETSKGMVDISWTSNGATVTGDVFTSPSEEKPDKTFKVSSWLTIASEEWAKDTVYTCRVSFGSTFAEKEIRKTSCNL
ncbi:immunoglobulin lambda-1 light chain-like [Aplochiton taeniatus]